MMDRAKQFSELRKIRQFFRDEPAAVSVNLPASTFGYERTMTREDVDLVLASPEMVAEEERLYRAEQRVSMANEHTAPDYAG